MLSHRLGMVPILADPRLFDVLAEETQPDESTSIVFRLNVRANPKP